MRKNSAPEMAAEQILKQIQGGELPPGAQLPPQRELAVLLGVGRSSVREAINALAVMGYLEAIQGRGTFVRSELPVGDPPTERLRAALEAGSIFDLMEARELLECKSVALAAERADARQIRRLRQILKDIDESDGVYEAFLAADVAFHTFLAEMTGNPVICEMTRLVLDKVVAHHARLRTTQLSPDYRENSVRTTGQIVACVENGEGSEAARWMRDHLNAIRGELAHIVS
ncbi:MAG: FadR family transcriptional regulator [Desulfobacterales bacterium]|nr:FadR family transcriptional regulator [Desulfobacterales bacterium]